MSVFTNSLLVMPGSKVFISCYRKQNHTGRCEMDLLSPITCSLEAARPPRAVPGGWTLSVSALPSGPYLLASFFFSNLIIARWLLRMSCHDTSESHAGNKKAYMVEPEALLLTLLLLVTDHVL